MVLWCFCHPGFLVVSGRDSLEMEKCSLFRMQ